MDHEKNQVLVLLFLTFGAITDVASDCNESIPVVKHAYPNVTGTAPLMEGTAVAYYCDTGFRGSGYHIFTCNNGSWFGDFQCRRRCDIIRELRNGRIVNQPNYIEGTRIAFECNKGYSLIGSKSLLCRANGEWNPSPPRCEIVSCGELGHIEHADINQEDQNGQYNVYNSSVYVTCNEGYVMQGSPIVKCNADGSWDPKPECKYSSCGTHPGYKSSCIAESSTSSDGTIVTFLCKDSSNKVSVTEIGSGTAFCSRGQWNNLDTGCFCDCRVKHNSSVQTFNLNQNNFVKHNTILQWSCKRGYRKETEADLKCFDGKINKIPSCLLVPSTTLPTSPYLTQTKALDPVIGAPYRPVHETSRYDSETYHHNVPTASASPTLEFLILVIVAIVTAIVVAVVLWKKSSSLKQKCSGRNEQSDAHDAVEKDKPKETTAMLPASNNKQLTPV